MEILDIYDKDRRRTGKTYPRNEEIPHGGLRLIIHILIFSDKGELLIQQRADHKKMGGLWDISCGGACQMGEDSCEGARRELNEELGIDFDFSSIRPILTANFAQGFDDFYILRKNIGINELKLQKEEVKAARFASRAEVLDLLAKGEFVKYKKSFLDLLFDLNDDERFMVV
ncbi:hydrolase, NUDIX family [Anaerococcus lactolyticus ATCC 51172]|uniref:Hydrolase, NUDIX family n=1 Tax=Anaerococcus lactolyticus ATCC 51172 TaxID=525254 RepID=C2BH65_9FIRM|nr:NUDIX domain-containing protein [Anaerococcus lactolyticus]EEI85708.1 hydrolase, NUDIX family [Anaerococcus lactolyticus ATCC 51172]